MSPVQFYTLAYIIKVGSFCTISFTIFIIGISLVISSEPEYFSAVSYVEITQQTDMCQTAAASMGERSKGDG